MDKTKQESDYFYIWKALACTLVVFIHCPFPGAARWILTAAARIGVPFFFSVSGWYLFRTDDSEQQVEQLKGKIKKTAHMLLRVGAAYTLFAVIVELSVGTFIPEWLSEKFSISEILKLLVYNSNSLVDSYAWHLWWLFAMLNCYVVLYCWKKLCKDFNLEKYGNKIGIVLLAVMLILQAVVPQKLAWYRNWLRISDPGILNRDITRPGEERVWSSSDPERLRNLTDYRQAELDNIICLRKGDSSCRPDSFAKFFWRTDHFVFQRPDFYTSVRMYSTRNANMEEPYNGEGLMNHFRGDGTNYLSVRGDEYKKLTPVYDWMKIPGATIVQLDKMPGENEIQKWGLTDYVGAVTDGTYGAVGFDFKSPHTGLAAKKVWFFFDKTYVCLGTNISSRMKNQVLTTVNQCLLNGEVTVSDADGIHPQEQGSRMKKEVRWVVHDKVGYYFLKKENVILSNQRTEGSWKIANRQTTTPADIIRQDVFTLSVDHGRSPNNGDYAYMVIPSADPLSIEKQVEEEGVVILANCPEVQAVRHDGLNMAYAAFYKGGMLRIHDKIVVEMDSPGMLMVKYNDAGEILALGVSDPTRFMKKLHLSVNQKIVGAVQENIQTEWDEKQALTRISVDLPQNEYAGKSVIYNK